MVLGRSSLPITRNSGSESDERAHEPQAWDHFRNHLTWVDAIDQCQLGAEELGLLAIRQDARKLGGRRDGCAAEVARCGVSLGTRGRAPWTLTPLQVTYLTTPSRTFPLPH